MSISRLNGIFRNTFRLAKTIEIVETTRIQKKSLSILSGSAKSRINVINVNRIQFRNESHLAKLRKKTGYAFSLCRQALELHEQDLVKAEKWLRAEAAKQGWEKAQSVKSRATGEGLIGIYTNPDRTQATMVEVKCETDFVARNEHFIRLVTDLAKQLSQQQSQFQQSNEESLNKIWIVDEQKLQDLAGDSITNAITKLGENIRLVRGCIVRVQNTNTETSLLPYTHAVAGRIDSNDSQVILGKYGTIIALQKCEAEKKSMDESEDDDTIVAESIDEVGSRLGQHIIGLSPLTVSPPQTENLEPDDQAVGDEEPNALLKQRFIFNDEITVEQFLNNSGAKVLDFVRFECGEVNDS